MLLVASLPREGGHRLGACQDNLLHSIIPRTNHPTSVSQKVGEVFHFFLPVRVESSVALLSVPLQALSRPLPRIPFWL